MMKNVLKNEKGLNLISLTVSVMVILILTGIILYNVKDNLGVQNLKNMQSDIGNLRDKVSAYYVEYGQIPVDTKYTNVENIDVISEAVDTGDFYIIDLAAMENVTLTYGRDYGNIGTVEDVNTLKDLYIINETSHNIFYVRGINLDGETFYTDYTKESADKVAVEIIEIAEDDENWSPEYDKTFTYKDENEDTAIIPEGFKVSRKEGENTINNGLVISDINNNEFVWVPVSKNDFETQFIRKDYGIQSLVDEDFVNNEFTEGKFYEPKSDGITIDKTASDSIQEIQRMYKSVKDYGGFYIGRYEAGKGVENNVLSKKGIDVYNNIGWSNSDDMINETGGAVEKAREFAQNHTSVESTLCYGVQWDAVMRWISEDDKLQEYLKDSSEVGNYDGKNPISKTGVYEVKNIYDMAGNVWEWTMESYGTNYKVYRGGCYNNDGNVIPITYRNNYESYPSTSTDSLGFRVALYLK